MKYYRHTNGDETLVYMLIYVYTFSLISCFEPPDRLQGLKYVKNSFDIILRQVHNYTYASYSKNRLFRNWCLKVR